MANELARVEIEARDGMSIAHIYGEVDISNADEIGKLLEEATADRSLRPVIDLTPTEYFDSAGIRLLFTIAGRLQGRRQQLVVVAPGSGIVRRVLDLTDLQRLVPVVASIEEVPPAT